MSWRAIFAGLALGLGFYLARFLLDAFRAPVAIAIPIEVLYAIVLSVFLVFWLAWSLKILFGSRHTAR
jgi:hypothetical protein